MAVKGVHRGQIGGPGRASPEPTRLGRMGVHEVRLEDIPLCASVQKGLHSLGYKQGRFNVDQDRTEVSEHAVHDFQLKWLKAMGEL